VGPWAGLDVCEKSHPHRDSMAVPMLKQLFVTLVALFPSRASQCRFVAGKVVLREVSHQVLQFITTNIIH
jgi:hypothetical protein